MPVNVPSLINDAVWSALQNGTETPALVLGGNRLNQADNLYWERQKTRKAANDFPNFRVEVGEEFVDSGYTGDDSYALAQRDYLQQTTSAGEREQVESVRIIVTDRMTPNYNPTVLRNLRVAMVRDILRAAPDLGLGTLTVQRVGPISGNIADGFVLGSSDPPIPAKILTIRYPVTVIQEIRASLV